MGHKMSEISQNGTDGTPKRDNGTWDMALRETGHVPSRFLSRSLCPVCPVPFAGVLAKESK
jgi:hypothetical protein